jgi:hypothetical protein
MEIPKDELLFLSPDCGYRAIIRQLVKETLEMNLWIYADNSDNNNANDNEMRRVARCRLPVR